MKTMTVRRELAFPLLLSSAIGCASASDLQLTAAEIKARIIGNTVVGIEDGKPYHEYFAPNGAIAGANDTETYSGAWRLDGDKLCTGYESEDQPGKVDEWTCSNVGLIGTRVIWNEDGDLTEGKLLPGRK